VRADGFEGRAGAERAEEIEGPGGGEGLDGQDEAGVADHALKLESGGRG
jgi:hypothetical protein